MITVPGIGPVEYLSVPDHPHNAVLEIWAEAGLVGAILLSVFVALLGERLARTSSSSRELSATGASLWVGSLLIGAFSYSIWNDAFWGAIVFAGSIVLALSRLASNQRRTAS